MTIALLLIAAFVLVFAMLFLTVGVNDLEKKSLELGELVRSRYTLRPQAKKGQAAAAAVPAAPTAKTQPAPGR